MLEDIRGADEKLDPIAEPDAEAPLAKSLKSVKKKLRRKTVIGISVASVCVLVVAAVAGNIFLHETPVSYREVQASISRPITSPTDFLVQTGGHNSAHIVLVDDTLYICYLDNIWSRLFPSSNNPQSLHIFDFNAIEPQLPAEPEPPQAPADPALPGSGSATSDGFVPPTPPTLPDPPEPPDVFALISSAQKIYYVETDLSRLVTNEIAFYRAIEKAVLVWEK